MEPLVPVTVMVVLPTAAVDEATNWNEESCIAPVGERSGTLPGSVVTPAGSPDSVRWTVPLNPFTVFAVTS